jgi:hypothetical protein
MRANIQAVSLKVQTLKSQNAMAEAMKGVTKAMQSMNKYKQFSTQIMSKNLICGFKHLKVFTVQIPF